MKKELRRDSKKSYQDVVNQTAAFLEVPPEDVNKIIKRFWRALSTHVIFRLGIISISGFGKVMPTKEHLKHRSTHIKLQKKIFNRRTEKHALNRNRKKKRTLLFSEYIR
jgi:hypothetical protein